MTQHQLFLLYDYKEFKQVNKIQVMNDVSSSATENNIQNCLTMNSGIAEFLCGSSWNVVFLVVDDH